MAFWNNSEYNPVGVGTNPNDGTGDVIRTAFIKVDSNFANISTQLGNPNQDWLNANVSINTNLNFANIANLFVANATGTVSNFTGNSTAGNVIAATGLYSNGTTNLNGNLYIAGSIIPTVGGVYNLGSQAFPFANLYVQTTVSTTQVTSSTSAGLFEIHANINPGGDTQDVGIFGNITNDYTSNTYTFFGHQYTTNNFIYKITPIDATKGNNIVAGGVYGNVQFGSAFLSNTTPATSPSTGALTVAGGTGIAGDLYTGGNAVVSGTIYTGGYQVLTTNTPGASNIYGGGNVFNVPVIITNGTVSTSTSTGALILSYGGAGIAGNVTAGALVGPLYGTVQTAAQPNITSVGTLNQLQVSTSVGAAAVFISGSGVTGAPLIVTSGGANIAGNLNSTGYITNTSGIVTQGNVNASFVVTAGTVINTGITTTGNIYTSANIIAAGMEINSGISSSGNISAGNISTPGVVTVNTLNATGNITAGNLTVSQVNANLQGTILTANQPNITGVSASANLAVASVYTNNYRFANGTAYVSTSIANTTEISANVPNGGTVGLNLVTTGVTAGTYGNASSIATFTTDSKGRILSASNVAVATSLGISGTSGTGSVALLTQSLAIAGGTDISTTASGQTVTVNTTSNLATVTGRGASTTTPLTLANITVGNITPAGNVTQNIGSSTSWFNSIYGTAVHAQYADLAENYLGDEEYAPGTVVVFGGNKEITVTTTFADTRVAGAISTNPAYLMNGANGGLPLALRGRVPCQVIGPVTKGDLLVTSTAPGYAASVGNDRTYGPAVFAKALETDLTDGLKTIEAVIL